MDKLKDAIATILLRHYKRRMSQSMNELADQILSIIKARVEEIRKNNPYYKSAVTNYGQESYNIYPEFAIFDEGAEWMRQEVLKIFDE